MPTIARGPVAPGLLTANSVSCPAVTGASNSVALPGSVLATRTAPFFDCGTSTATDCVDATAFPSGKVIISEKNFLAKLPDAAGYRFFLIDAPVAKAKDVSADLTKQLEQRGLALEPANDRFNAFSAVQNTYIGIFTVLGGLGVLLRRSRFRLVAAETRNLTSQSGDCLNWLRPRAFQRLLVQLLDDGAPGAANAVAIAKARAGQTATTAVQEGVQMHGGMGMTDEYDIGLYMKRERALTEFMGDANYHAERVAQLSGY